MVGVAGDRLRTGLDDHDHNLTVSAWPTLVSDHPRSAIHHYDVEMIAAGLDSRQRHSLVSVQMPFGVIRGLLEEVHFSSDAQRVHIMLRLGRGEPAGYASSVLPKEVVVISLPRLYPVDVEPVAARGR